jgi:hypothetical protein
MNKGEVNFLFLGVRPLFLFLKSRTALVKRWFFYFNLLQLLQKVLLSHNFYINVIDAYIIMPYGRTFGDLAYQFSLHVRLKERIFVLCFFHWCVNLKITSWTDFINCLFFFESYLCRSEALVLGIPLCLGHDFVLNTQFFCVLVTSGSWLVLFLKGKVPLLRGKKWNVRLVMAFLWM